MFSQIFYKDLKLASRWLLAYPFILLEWVIAYYLFADRLDWEVDQETFVAGCLTVAFVMNTILSMVVGIGVIADEEDKGTDQFLKRLPLSTFQVLREKIFAGICFLLFLYAISFFVYAVFLPEGAILLDNNREDDIGTYPINLFVAMFTSFIFSVAASTVFKQQIIIFLITLVAECSIWIGLRLVMTRTELQVEGALISIWYMALIFGLPALLAWKNWRFSLNPSIWGSPQSRTLFKGLVFKHIAQDGLLYILSGGLLVIAIIYAIVGPDMASLTTRMEVLDVQSSFTYLAISGLAIFMPITVGASAYSNNEGQGLACTLYLQPVSRTQLFLSKILAALPIIAISYFGLLITLGDRWPSISLFVWTIFAYAIALHISLWIPSLVLIILAAVSWGVFLLSMVLIWMEPTVEFLFFGSFVPNYDYRIVALIPLTFLTIGSLVSSWHMATNRKFLAGSIEYKAKFNALESCAVYAVAILGVGVVQQFVTL
ncbi:MAG: hypothetical protein GKR91_11505 [Pseudomonadales bacterium]|nr:hypothetical protein [Pseudomonadales bacterium]